MFTPFVSFWARHWHDCAYVATLLWKHIVKFDGRPDGGLREISYREKLSGTAFFARSIFSFSRAPPARHRRRSRWAPFVLFRVSTPVARRAIIIFFFFADPWPIVCEWRFALHSGTIPRRLSDVCRNFINKKMGKRPTNKDFRTRKTPITGVISVAVVKVVSNLSGINIWTRYYLLRSNRELRTHWMVKFEVLY